MSTTQTYLYLSDNVIELDNLQDSTGAYLNSATVTVTLYEQDLSTEVSGETWPLTMSHVSESPDQGKYKATLVDTLSVTKNKKYIAAVSVDGGDGKAHYWEIPVRVLVDNT